MSERVCDRCGSDSFVDVPIHDGRSTRRDCARCGKMIDFPIWYGVTSTRSAAAVALAPIKQKLLRKVFDYLAKCGARGATDEEIARSLRMRESTARARRVELRDDGHVRDSHRTRRSSAGRPCVVWIASREPLS